ISRRGYRFIATVDEVSVTPASGEIEAQTLQIQTLAKRQTLTLDQPQVSSPAISTTTNQRRFLSSATVLAGLLLLALLAWKHSKDTNTSAISKTLPAAPVALKVDKLTQTGESRLVAVSPDGKYLAYTRTKNQKTAIWLRQLDNETNVELVPGTAPI